MREWVHIQGRGVRVKLGGPAIELQSEICNLKSV
jgi:hypothetical protein